jgi:hypothetical protein
MSVTIIDDENVTEDDDYIVTYTKSNLIFNLTSRILIRLGKICC